MHETRVFLVELRFKVHRRKTTNDVVELLRVLMLASRIQEKPWAKPEKNLGKREKSLTLSAMAFL